MATSYLGDGDGALAETPQAVRVLNLPRFKVDIVQRGIAVEDDVQVIRRRR